MIPISQLLGYNPIDIHSHFDHGATGDWHEIASPPSKNVHIATLDFLRKQYDSVGIRCGAFSTFSSCYRCDTVSVENVYLKSIAETVDWVYQWAVIDPRQEETFRQAEQLLPLPKTLGIKIHPKLHEYTLAEYGDTIFSFANEKGAVILTHPENFSDMVSLADKYPNIKLIIAHLGTDSFIDAIAASKHKNIYTDTSGSASHLNNIIERAVDRVGADRILFGTDTYSAAFQLGRITWADIDDHAKRQILLDNALELFPNAFTGW